MTILHNISLLSIFICDAKKINLFYTELCTILFYPIVDIYEQCPFPLYYPVTCHTDHVSEGTVFVAIQGMKEDGVAYIPKAIAQGARKIVLDEKAQLPESINRLIVAQQIDVVRVDNTRKALAHLSAQAHGFPAKS